MKSYEIVTVFQYISPTDLSDSFFKDKQEKIIESIKLTDAYFKERDNQSNLFNIGKLFSFGFINSHKKSTYCFTINDNYESFLEELSIKYRVFHYFIVFSQDIKTVEIKIYLRNYQTNNLELFNTFESENYGECEKFLQYVDAELQDNFEIDDDIEDLKDRICSSKNNCTDVFSKRFLSGWFRNCNKGSYSVPHFFVEYNCKKIESVTKLTIPSSIKKLNKKMITNCPIIEQIWIYASVDTIPFDSFTHCPNLTDVFLADNIKYIQEGCFMYCSNLIKINLDYVSAIGFDCFIGTNIHSSKFNNTLSNSITEKNIELSNGIMSISNREYADNKVLENITIPDSCNYIGESAFSGCDNLKIIRLPNTLKSISRKMFSLCDSLESIVIPDSVIAIEDYAFENCSKLKNIILGKSIQIIGESAFSCCYSLKEIILPESIKTIKQNAFSYCINLEKITIPKNLNKIENDVFLKCHNLKIIENIYSILDINPNIVKKLPQFEDNDFYPEDFDIGTFSPVKDFTTKTPFEFDYAITKLKSKYENTFSIMNFFIDYINNVEPGKIAKKYNISKYIIETQLKILAMNISFAYFDNNYLPLLVENKKNRKEIKEIFSLNDSIIRYLHFKHKYLSKEYVKETPREIEEKISEYYIHKQELEKQKQIDAFEHELQHAEKRLMHELRSLLKILNKTEFCLEGLFYDYFFSIDSIDKLIIKKSNESSIYKMEYDFINDSVVYFTFSDTQNKLTLERYKKGQMFINEINSLFVSLPYSKQLTRLYNELSRRECRGATYQNTENNYRNNFKCTKIDHQVLELCISDISEQDKISYTYRKIPEVPVWFVISMDNKYTCVDKPKRLLTFFSDTYPEDSILAPTIYSPSTIYEQFISNFVYNDVIIKTKNSSILVKERCPLCNSPMIEKNGVHGKFLGCTQYPNCKGSRSIKENK